MSSKLKALGLGLLAIVAISAFGVVNAGANSDGDFDLGTGATTVKGEESGTHNLIFTPEGTGSAIDCKTATYSGGVSAGTVGSITITPAWSNCSTAGSASEFGVDLNGCKLTFTVGQHAEGDNTVSVCSSGGPIEITHPNCLITVEKQTVSGAAADPDTREGAASITLTSTATVATKYHGGICVLLGTNHSAVMEGSATVWAEDENGNAVDLVATGSED